MCGIAGIVSPDYPMDAETIRQMTDIATHRGPDDEGFTCWGKIERLACLPAEKSAFYEMPGRSGSGHLSKNGSIALGHRRLSILDLSPAGRQPMCSADGRLWIVFNGEIYNFLELRTELSRAGYAFLSSSDTEVILAAYQKWGAKCLDHFNGMWSFAIYDLQEQVLFAARDRFGVKPFYFAVDRDRFGFASEIKQLRAGGFGNGQANRSKVARFLLSGNVNGTRETLFEGIMQLLPGEALRWPILKGIGAIQTYRYYCPGFNLEMHADGSLEEYRARFEYLLNDAVRLRLRSDVPVGTCLSGGLDSSSIVVAASRILGAVNGTYRQKTFTACFEDPTVDEWEYASAVASATGAEAHQVFPNLDLIWDEIRTLTWHQEEPFRSTSIYAQWNVMRLAHQNGLKVVLEGQGADEVLAGYHRYIPEFVANLIRRGQFSEASEQLWAMWRTGILTASEPVTRIVPKVMRGILGLKWFRDPATRKVMHEEYGKLESESPTVGFQHQLYDDLFGYLQSLLRQGDRNSMAFSVESRTPFLDYRLVEMFLGMPGVYKLRDGWTKPFTREAMRGLMPETVRLRVDKKGFATPEATWYARNLGRIREVLLSSDSRIDLWLDRTKLKRWLGNGACSRLSGSSLWRILSVHYWAETFNLS
jgi:asparagine synthase (glutamine-hydrolysing)